MGTSFASALGLYGGAWLTVALVDSDDDCGGCLTALYTAPLISASAGALTAWGIGNRAGTSWAGSVAGTVLGLGSLFITSPDGWGSHSLVSYSLVHGLVTALLTR